MATMRAVMKKDAGLGTSIETVDVPKCGPEDVLLKVKAASICGTDLHIYKWDSWAQGVIKPPLILGHEICGEIVEFGARVEGFAAGDLVSVESHIPCGKCYQCRHDLRHICDDLKIVGVHRPGGFAEYLSIPAVCAWKNGPGINVEVAALLEPLGNAVYAASEAQVAGQNVAVFGCGPAGLFTVAACKALGAVKVIAVDVNPKHLEMATSMGADELLDGADPGLMERLEALLMERSGGRTALRRFDQVFFDGDAKEAVAFALLGYLTIHGQPGNLPAATGAAGPRVLGTITPA